MKNMIREHAITQPWTNGTGSDVASGRFVAVKSGAQGTGRVGVAITDIADGADGELRVKGVFVGSKTSADAPAQGDKVYLIVATGVLTTTATGNTYAGKAFRAASAGDEDVQVELNAA